MGGGLVVRGGRGGVVTRERRGEGVVGWVKSEKRGREGGRQAGRQRGMKQQMDRHLLEPLGPQLHLHEEVVAVHDWWWWYRGGERGEGCRSIGRSVEEERRLSSREAQARQSIHTCPPPANPTRSSPDQKAAVAHLRGPCSSWPRSTVVGDFVCEDLRCNKVG